MARGPSNTVLTIGALSSVWPSNPPFDLTADATLDADVHFAFARRSSTAQR